MPPQLSSFAIHTASLKRVIEAAQQHHHPETSGLLLLSGSLASQGKEMALALSAAPDKGRWLIVPSPGVLSQEGETESEAAAVGLVLPGVSTQILVGAASNTVFGAELGQRLRRAPGASALVLLRGDQDDDGWLVELERELGERQDQVFGGGTFPHIDLWQVEGTEVTKGAAASFIVERPWLGRVTSSSACRLLSPLHTVTKTRGPLLLELDGMPALDLLSASAEELDEQPLVLLAIGGGQQPLSPEGRNLALRAIVGVDPTKQGVLMGDELPRGTQVAFAVRDAHAARSDLDAHLRSLRRNCAGAAPAFGIYVSCAGRGRALYESPDVDIKLIKQHFPKMPMAGLHSTYEIAPLGGRLTPQVYSGVLGVFCAPS